MPIAAMKSRRRVDSSRWFKQRTEVSASEPLVKCRKAIRRCRNWRATLSPGSAWGMPETARATSNMLAGAKLNQALVRNVRTYTAMLREKAQAGSNCEAESTDPDVHSLPSMYFGTPVVSIGVAIARPVTDRRSTASMRRPRLPYVWRSASLLGGRWISGRARFALSRRAVNGARSTSRQQRQSLRDMTEAKLIRLHFGYGMWLP